MREDRLIWSGGIGAIVTAICCFTPTLAVIAGVLGLSVWIGWIDYLLLPALALFLGMVWYGLLRRRRRRVEGCAEDRAATRERPG
jgi:mercuric ion transport protein